MTSNEIRKKYFEFFKERGHSVIPSASLLPENDPTTLFTGSGMQPLLPYLLGKKHPEGAKIVDSQKSFRAEDIEEVGDNRHTTFFEMLGNWSLGDYFKKEQLPWFFEFLTDVVGLDPQKLYVSVFAGDEANNIPRDEESVQIWQDLFGQKGIEATVVDNAEEKGMQNGRIFYYGAGENWWSRAGLPDNMPAGEPGGPDSEVFYDFETEHDPAFGEVCHPACDCGRFLEIGNSVFMEYIKNEDLPAPRPGIYFVYAILCENDSIYIGQTQNLINRWHDHLQGLAAEHTKKYKPKKIIHYEEYNSREEAVQREKDLKTGFGRKWLKRELKAGRTRQAGGSFENLPQKNVDFGGGLERITAASNNSPDVFEIDVFKKIINYLESVSGLSYSDEKYQRSFRVVADHLRATVFVISDGAHPSNTEAGYITRRLLRRAVRHMDIMGVSENTLDKLVGAVVDNYKEAYPKLAENKNEIEEAVKKEEEKFRRTLKKGLKEFGKLAEKNENISGKDAFILFSTYGFPFDLTVELAEEKGMEVDKEGFEAEMEKHKGVSRAGAEQKFKGGLADHSEMSVKYHTATHLLHQALRDVLGDHVFQTGSNITPERLRFDFSHGEKMTEEQIKETEDIVNQKIKEALPVFYRDIPKEKAAEMGAIGLFEDTYGDTVRVYAIGADPETSGRDEMYSLEYCGGPHVENTSELGHFKIVKEESISAGKRRIKAVLE